MNKIVNHRYYTSQAAANKTEPFVLALSRKHEAKKIHPLMKLSKAIRNIKVLVRKLNRFNGCFK